MPNRDIKESCRTSESLAQLTHGAERLFWRLTVTADDYGRFDARPGVLRAACFSVMLGTIREAEVARWLTELVKTDIVRVYEVDGKCLGYFVNWTKHQRVRAKQSKWPAPPPAVICQQMPAYVPGTTVTTVVPENTEDTVNTEYAQSGRCRPAPAHASIQFQIPASITEALNRAPVLGAQAKLRTPEFWRAMVRAHSGVDYGREILKAEAWMVANPTRAPKKNFGRFMSNWLGNASRDDGEAS